MRKPVEYFIRKLNLKREQKSQNQQLLYIIYTNDFHSLKQRNDHDTGTFNFIIIQDMLISGTTCI